MDDRGEQLERQNEFSVSAPSLPPSEAAFDVVESILRYAQDEPTDLDNRAIQLPQNELHLRKPEPEITTGIAGRRWRAGPGIVVLLIGSGISFVGPVLVGVSLIVVGLVWLLIWAAIPESQEQDHNGRPQERAGKKPFRSRILGTAIKCFGVAIIVGWFWRSPSTAWWENSLYAAHMMNVAMYGLGAGLVFRGYQLSIRTFDPGCHPDKREPVLYLRGFSTDGQITLQPDTILSRLYGIRPKWDEKGGQANSWGMGEGLLVLNPIRVLRMLLNIGADSVAQVLAIGFSRCGPLVAIGRPGDSLALPGADQMYVPDEQWQQVVLEYLNRCKAVVLVPSNSDGVQWEIDQVFERVPLHRILLYMAEFHGKPNEYAHFRARLWWKHQIRLPIESPSTDAAFFVYFERDGTPRLQEVCLSSPVLWPLTGNAVDARGTFRSFIQGLEGEVRQPPAEPSRYPGHGFASLVLAAVLVAGLVYLPEIWACLKRELNSSTQQMQGRVR